MAYKLYLVFFFLPGISGAQLTGVAVNPAGETLPFVNILINGDSHSGVTADLDGRFQIPVKEKITRLDFSYVGYQSLRLDFPAGLQHGPLRVVLQPVAYEFSAVEVVAGENPADRVMRKAAANRRRNDPDKALAAYRCRTYNKQVYRFDPDTSVLDRKKNKMDSTVVKRIDRLVRQSGERHFFILESVTDRKYKRPGQLSENILYSKAAGFKTLPIAPLAADVQPFAFYGAEVPVFEKEYLNPVSPGSEQQYFFSMEDTLFRGADSIFVIRFHPRKGKNFDGLRGVLYIHSFGYAIRNLIAEPADTTGNLKFRIEQQYRLVDGTTWFPSELHFEFGLPKYPMPGIGLAAYGRSYIDSIEIAPVFDQKDFRTAEKYTFSKSAFDLPDSLWTGLRREPLDRKEQRTYVVVDSFGEKHHLDRWMDRLGLLSTGRLPLGFFDADFRKALSINEFEGFRLGAGLYTSERRWKTFGAGGYVAYGFKDKKWKYGFEGVWRIAANRDRALRLAYADDIEEPGLTPEFPEPGLISRRTFARRMDNWKGWTAALEGQLARSLEAVVQAKMGEIRPLYAYQWANPGGEPGAYSLFETTLYLRFTPGEQYTRVFGVRIPEGNSKYPGLYFSWRRGWEGAAAGDLGFDQIWAGMQHRFRVRWLGETSYRIEGGRVTGNAPLSRLYSSTGIGVSGLRLQHEFQTMQYQEFFSDRLAVVSVAHSFGKLLFKTRWLQPVLSVEQRFAIGSLDNRQRHEGLVFDTLEKGFWESGLVVDNLIRINYFNVMHIGFGVAAYRRFGAYELPGGWKQNGVVRLSVYLEG